LLNQKHKRLIDLMIATLFGVGFLKPAPGTLGSIVALLFLLFPLQYYLAINISLILLTFISYFSIKNIEKEFGDDPSIIIIDEFIAMGLILTSSLIPTGIYTSIIALILFRIFDIFKPYPINLINRKKGAWFVLLDDLLAGVLTIITLKLLIYLNNLIILWKIID